MKIVKLMVESFVKRVQSLDVGEHFDFANGTDYNGVLKSEEELSEWYGVQKLYLFDNEMCIVSKYGGKGCRAFSTEDDYLAHAVADMFYHVLFTDFVYAVGTNEKQMPSVTLTADICLNISGGCGDSILISSSKVHDIMGDIEAKYAIEDIKKKIEDMDNIAVFSEDEIRQIAEEIIDRRDDCDLIYEIYWEIVENVIKEFSERKKQEA